jgi:hypothetical protein
MAQDDLRHTCFTFHVYYFATTKYIKKKTNIQHVKPMIEVFYARSNVLQSVNSVLASLYLVYCYFPLPSFFKALQIKFRFGTCYIFKYCLRGEEWLRALFSVTSPSERLYSEICEQKHFINSKSEMLMLLCWMGMTEHWMIQYCSMLRILIFACMRIKENFKMSTKMATYCEHE